MSQAVFLDRDGTLIKDKDYLHRAEDVAFIPGAVMGLQRLHRAGFKLFLVTNQSGVGRGYFTMDNVDRVHAHISGELAKEAVRFEKIYVAPEAPDRPSHGRKPSPQFLFDARDEFGIDLGGSFMIGDKRSDLECGWNAGVEKAILVRTGYGAALERAEGRRLAEAMIVNDLSSAAEWILKGGALREARGDFGVR